MSAIHTTEMLIAITTQPIFIISVAKVCFSVMLNPSERLESSLIIRKGPKSQDGHQFQQKPNLYNSVSTGEQFLMQSY